jgi:hypothetical protein
MYWLMSADAIIRIAFAMVFLFIIVPALALPRRPAATYLERFFWNLGLGITVLTLVGEVLTLASLFSLLTLLLVAALIILLGQAAYRGQSPATLVRHSLETAFLAFLNVLDGRVNVPRRIRRLYRRTIAAFRQKTQSRLLRLQIAGWAALTAIAAGLRLYRPLVSANLGFSDTYVHLYFLKLLEDGRQVDPQWGPYPHGMHFLLMAVHRLTNVDEILLLNFFGAFVGVLITLAVADTSRRLSKSLPAGLLAGFLFATVVGGPSQYFVLGGVFTSHDQKLAATFGALPYGQVPEATGEFDLALTAFQRQTSTLPQELAMALLFPAAMFLLGFFQTGDRWQLLGFAGCTAAIADVHSGILLPLFLMSVVMLLALIVSGRFRAGTLRPALMAGVVAVVVGSAWSLAFIAYPYIAGAQSTVGTLLLYYFPITRRLLGGQPYAIATTGLRSFVFLTPLLGVCIVLAIGLIVSSLRHRDELRANLIWISAIFLMFVLGHLAWMFGLPQLVEVRRSAQWLIM